MIIKLFMVSAIFTLSSIVNAAVVNTNREKIEFTEGHITPNCRSINFVENESGASKHFRIDTVENSDVSSVVLTALATQNDVQIWFDEAITSGCGSEPHVYYIRPYAK